MKKYYKKWAAILAAGMFVGALAACGGDQKAVDNDAKATQAPQATPTVAEAAPEETPTVTEAAPEATPTIAEAVTEGTEQEKENSGDEKDAQGGEEKDNKGEENVAFEFVDVIKVADTLPMYVGGGTIEEISYETKDYFGDKAAIVKKAFVYLPAGYSEEKQYNVLYLMHGIGGSEREWGMTDMNSKVKAMMDHLTADGVIEPFIIVAPNGRSGKDFADPNSDFNSFYLFGQELRNELIPYIDSHYSTYAQYSADGYDLTAARDHRAMAGLSMGGMQTTNIGMCESLDIMSYFGAFSAAPTTYQASKIAEILKNFEEYPIHYYYGICGKQDGIAYNPAHAAVSGLTALTDKLTDGENFTWQEVNGQHDFNVWYLGFYNFAQIVFR